MRSIVSRADVSSRFFFSELPPYPIKLLPHRERQQFFPQPNGIGETRRPRQRPKPIPPWCMPAPPLLRHIEPPA